MNKAELEKNKKNILKRYFDDEASLKVVADEFSTYVNCIRRAILGWGYTLRNRSQAQTAALSSGRHDHPTKGKQHSQQTKIKISEGKVKDWDGLSHAEYQDRVQKAEDQWAAMSPERKEEMARLGGDGIRRASKEGSKAEQELRFALTAAGYDVAFHAKNIIPNAKLEVDLFLPAHNIVIEIDGPAHFFPLWGEEQLQRHIKADTEKLGLCCRMVM